MNTHCIQLDHHLTHVEIINVPAGGASHEVDASVIATKRAEANHEASKQLLHQISTRVQQLQSEDRNHVEQVTTISVQLASIITQKIVGRSDVIQKQRLEQLIREALSRTEPAVCIRLHSQDVSRLESLLKHISDGNEGFNIESDDSVDEGECRIEYEGYELASSLSQQIEEIQHRLLEVLNHD